MVTTKKFVRVPLYVDAIQVSNDNIEEVAKWVKGSIQQTDIRKRGLEKYIFAPTHSPMNERQKMAFPGDWMLKTDKGFKIYTNDAFKNMFEPYVSPQAPSPEDFDANEMALKEKLS